MLVMRNGNMYIFDCFDRDGESYFLLSLQRSTTTTEISNKYMEYYVSIDLSGIFCVVGNNWYLVIVQQIYSIKILKTAIAFLPHMHLPTHERLSQQTVYPHGLMMEGKPTKPKMCWRGGGGVSDVLHQQHDLRIWASINIYFTGGLIICLVS